MKPYKAWDFCKAIDCDALGLTEETRKIHCHRCEAYKFHQFLKEHDQILEEGSTLIAKMRDTKDIISISCEEYRMQKEKIETIEERVREAEKLAQIAKEICTRNKPAPYDDRWTAIHNYDLDMLKKALAEWEGSK